MHEIPELIFATNNRHKVEEIAAVLPPGIHMFTLQEAGIRRELAEPFDTLQANAIHKARQVHALTGANCFAEDTGLEVEALDGRPGVYSARYGGEPRDDARNIQKLLQELAEQPHRKARFRTVLALIWQQSEYLFEGICRGRISEAPMGNGGFGYDPVFIPEGSEISFAQMAPEAKHRISHRTRALDGMVAFFATQNLAGAI